MCRSPRPTPSRAVQHQHHSIRILQRLVDRVLHPLGQPVERLLEPGQVNQHQLPAVALDRPQRPPTGRLGTSRDGRDVLADQPVDERRLARVRPAGQRHQSRPVFAWGQSRKRSGRRSASDDTTGAPSRRQITRSSGANSASTWRHEPQGGTDEASPCTAIASKPRAPDVTADTAALRSAQMVRPKLAFSTLTPRWIVPSVGAQRGADGEVRVRRVRERGSRAGDLVQLEVGFGDLHACRLPSPVARPALDQGAGSVSTPPGSGRTAPPV